MKDELEAVEVPRPRRMLDGVPPDTRVIIVDVTWGLYEKMVDAVREGEHCRIAFDGKDIEMMTLGPRHERQKSFLDLFITFVADELRIECESMGSTTWRRKKVKRGIESDLCYYFDPAKLAAVAAAQDRDDIEFYPNPDMAVEVDISPPKIDRPGIYAKLEVTEVWRARNNVVTIEQLGPDGTYTVVDRSRYLPVRSEDVTRWVFLEDRTKRSEWIERLRAWARTIA